MDNNGPIIENDFTTEREQLLEIPDKRKPLWIWVMVIGVLLISGAGYWYWTTTPQYSLRCIGKSIKQHDLAIFKKYVDVDSMANRAVNQLIDVYMDDPEIGDDNINELAQGVVEVLKSQLVKLFTNEIESFVESGEFEANEDSEGEGISPNELWNKAGSKSANLIGISNVKKEGKIAVVGMKIQLPEYNSEIVLDLKMRDRGNYWQLVEISNIGDAVKKLDKLEKDKLDKLNKPIQDSLNKIVDFKSTAEEGFSDDWGIDQYIDYTFDLSINGKEPVIKIDTEFQIWDNTGSLLLQETPVFEGNWAPGWTGQLSFRKDINYFIDEESQLWEIPTDQLNVEIRPTGVTYASGKKIELLEELPEE